MVRKSLMLFLSITVFHYYTCGILGILDLQVKLITLPIFGDLS